MKRAHGICMLSAAGAALASTGAYAQELQALEEIVVTAQRREQDLQKVPIAVSAFTQADLERMAVQNVGDVLEYAPNVTRASGPSGGGDGFFYIRGIGQVDNSVTVDPGVGVYIDEVYLGRLQGASLDLLDVARVEVLRGPQGTLFGRNTIGGAINVTTADPGQDFGFKGRVIAGDRNRIDAQASIDAPLGETAGVKFSGFMKQQDGWAKNRYTGDTFGDVDDAGGRVKLVWEPSEAFTLKLAGDYATSSGSPINTSLSAFNATQPLPPPAPPGAVGPTTTPTGVPFPADLGVDISTDPEVSRMSVPNTFDEDTGGVSLNLSIDMGGVTLRSISAYRMVDQQVYNDLDGAAYALYDSYQDVDQEQLSQELQLSGETSGGGFKWLLGAYYFEESVTGYTEICVGTNRPAGPSFNVPNPAPPPPTLTISIPGPSFRLDGRCLKLNSAIDLDIESYAGFAHTEFRLSDRWRANLGLRYTHETKDQAFDSELDNTDGVASLIPGPFMPPPGQVQPVVSVRNPMLPPSLIFYDESWSKVTPKVGVDFDQSDDVMWYLSWSEGFKSGGFGGRATPLAPIEAYDPETISTYELGVKSMLADSRVRLNANVFFSKYEDIQLLELNPATLGFETKNAGTNESKGVEVEFLAKATDRFDVQLGVGYIDSEFTKLNPGTEVELSDALPVTPEWTYNAALQYTFPLGSFGSLALRGDYNYRSELSFQAGNDPFELQDGYGLLNLRATFSTNDERYYFALYGMNVTDEEYKVSAVDALSDLNVAIANYGAPAEYGVEFGVRL